MKIRIAVWLLIMAVVTFIAFYPKPVALADGGPIPMCGPPDSEKCKLPQEPRKPDPTHPTHLQAEKF